MRARDIVGRKVVRVEQERTYDDNHELLYELRCIVFDNGTELWFNVAEMPGDYAVMGVVVKKGEVASYEGPHRNQR